MQSIAAALGRCSATRGRGNSGKECPLSTQLHHPRTGDKSLQCCAQAPSSPPLRAGKRSSGMSHTYKAVLPLIPHGFSNPPHHLALQTLSTRRVWVPPWQGVIKDVHSGKAVPEVSIHCLKRREGRLRLVASTWLSPSHGHYCGPRRLS